MTDRDRVRFVLEIGHHRIASRQRCWWVSLHEIKGPRICIVSARDDCRTRKAALVLAKERLRKALR